MAGADGIPITWAGAPCPSADVDRYWAVTTVRRPERIRFASIQHREILSLMRQGAGEDAGAKMREHVMAEAEVCLETVRAIQAEVTRSRAAAG